MRIINETLKTKKYFKELKEGDIFIYESMYFIRMESICDNNPNIIWNAVNIKNGAHYCIHPETEIRIPYDSFLTVIVS